MSKEAITISVEHSIIEAHRNLNTNVSKLCNEALAAYLTSHGQELIKDAEKQTVFTKAVVKSAQEQAQIDAKLQDLLEKARQVKADYQHLPAWKKGLKGVFEKYNYEAYLKEACKLTGLPMHKIVRRL